MMGDKESNRTEILEESAEVTQLFSIMAQANQIASNTELDELLEQMLALIASVCGANVGAFYLLDGETNELVFKVVHGNEESQKLVGQRISTDMGISGAALREERPIIINDLPSDPLWLGRFLGRTQKQLRNCISIPLLLRGKAIGVVQVFNYRQVPLELVQLLGNRMASEIDKTVLLKTSNDHGKRLEALVGIIKEMTLTLDRDLLLNHIIHAARELLNAEISFLFLIDEGSNDLVLSIYSDTKEFRLQDVRIPAGKGIIGKVVASGEPLLVNDIKADQRHHPYVDRIEDLEITSILAVPLQTSTVALGRGRGSMKSRIIGGIEAINKIDGNFSQEDIQMLTTLGEQAATVLLFAGLYADANELFIDTIKAISAAIDAKDPYTRGHSQRVSDFSRVMAQELDLPAEIIHHIRVGGLLHDVGKIGIPDMILAKPGHLTDEEFDIIKDHTGIGANIMKEVRMLQHELPALAEHHERMDGKGYPNGLSDKQISLVGRIVAVADVFDALTSDRPYRDALSAEEALDILNRERDTHLDGQIVDVFIRAYLDGKIRTQRERDRLTGEN